MKYALIVLILCLSILLMSNECETQIQPTKEYQTINKINNDIPIKTTEIQSEKIKVMYDDFNYKYFYIFEYNGIKYIYTYDDFIKIIKAE